MWILSIIKDLIAPKICYSCWKEWAFLCPRCQLTLEKYQPFCYGCKKSSVRYKIHNNCKKNYSNIDQTVVIFHYKNPKVKELIKDAKYNGIKDIYHDFVPSISKAITQNTDSLQNTIIIASPMYIFKKIRKWYNHSEALAKSVGKDLKVPYNFRIVKKIKNTRAQASLSRKERLNNQQWVYKIIDKYKSLITWKNILIIDDVISTGTTLNSIAETLAPYKPKKIICVCIASD